MRVKCPSCPGNCCCIGIEVKNYPAFQDWQDRAFPSWQYTPAQLPQMGLKPVKCPCCDGYGERVQMVTTKTGEDLTIQACKACGGKGILWS